ncbi:TetR/AcrR family transcriptional regulator [Actinacidiphila alni]|uniref:TetR/AcrR family transcriptional regulator n=1 Tax=Actinacidiphila alni TaxID=380248 RepID=UPI000B86334F|nr:TetR/AcrR family transcriptional regulator [Actinacidiphila alni]
MRPAVTAASVPAADHDGEQETGRYGRRRVRPGLTPAAIVTAGRRLIEREGLEALTMRAVAAELNTAPASLYRHVADRDALLLAILEQIAEGLPVEVPGRTPRTRLRRRWLAAHTYMADHVWVLHILIRGEMVAETAFRFTDACLADFLAAGLSPAKAMRAFYGCWHLTIGELLDGHPLKPPREPSQRQRAVARVDPEQLPALARVTAALPPREHRRDDFPGVLDTLLSGFLAEARTPTVKSRGAGPSRGRS